MLYAKGKQILDLEERDRRYKLVREKMAAKGLDALVVFGNTMHEQKGYARYFTNFHNIMYYAMVIFPLKGEPKFIAPTPVQQYWAQRLCWIKNVESSNNFGESLVKNLKDMGLADAKLGVINNSLMTGQIYVKFKEGLPNANVTDATELMDEARMIKSEKEHALARVTGQLCDLSFEVAARVIKPGITEREAIATIDRELMANGTEYIFHLFAAVPNSPYPYLPTDRIIQKGDVILMNTELAGPEGYWVQSSRTMFLGEPDPVVDRMFECAVNVRKLVQKELGPNKKAGEFVQMLRKVIADAGFDATSNFGHGMGLDVVERPRMIVPETWSTAPGMVVAVHPALLSKDAKSSVMCGDAYIITKTGNEQITGVDPETIKIIG